MTVFAKDGLSLLPEVMDSAILRSNVLPHDIKGRDEIGRVLAALETLYHDTVDIERISSADREMIVTRTLLSDGERATIHIVGLRDHEGWIHTILMNHEPPSAAHLLAQQTAQLI